jgi:hypothetical protein
LSAAAEAEIILNIRMAGEDGPHHNSGYRRLGRGTCGK